jgi:hypothetical protein
MDFVKEHNQCADVVNKANGDAFAALTRLLNLHRAGNTTAKIFIEFIYQDMVNTSDQKLDLNRIEK